jgi:hypothetical protein
MVNATCRAICLLRTIDLKRNCENSLKLQKNLQLLNFLTEPAAMLKRIWSHTEETQCSGAPAHFGSLCPSARREQMSPPANNSHQNYILLLACNLLKLDPGK